MAHYATTFEIRKAANDDDPAPVLQRAMLAMVTRGGTDLSARQLGIFLTVYLEPGPHTVRGLAARFRICKPAVTRALNTLGEMDLLRRRVDPSDRRSVLVQRTGPGWALLGELRAANDRGAGGRAVPPGPRPRPPGGGWPGGAVERSDGQGRGFTLSALAD